MVRAYVARLSVLARSTPQDAKILGQPLQLVNVGARDLKHHIAPFQEALTLSTSTSLTPCIMYHSQAIGVS